MAEQHLVSALKLNCQPFIGNKRERKLQETILAQNRCQKQEGVFNYVYICTYEAAEENIPLKYGLTIKIIIILII